MIFQIQHTRAMPVVIFVAQVSTSALDDAVEYLLGNSFTWVLVLSFLAFWINMFYTWLLLNGMPGDHPRRSIWIGATVLMGPFAWLLYSFAEGGRTLLGQSQSQSKMNLRKKNGRATSTSEMALITRDAQRIEGRLGRKVTSGLKDALRLLAEATNRKASDIHLDVMEDGVQYAFRVDGRLRPPETLDYNAGRRVMSVLKTAAGIDYANQHESRDGACTFICGDKRYDLRVARAWAVNGETIVVRTLESHGEEKSLENLGVPPRFASELRSLMAEQNGLIVFAGPVGSGKTTTLYSLLRSVDGEGRAILTIEDPVEYRLPTATQISLNSKTASTFATTLKSSMRHDCDIILVGEARDQETMEVAFQAALTGHLVLTTFHASSIQAVWGRLRQLGINSFMIGAGLRAIVCQRLIRKLCTECHRPYVPDPDEKRKWGLGTGAGPETVFYVPGECGFCEWTGFRGRTAIVHYVLLDRDIRDRLTQGEKDNQVLPDILRRVRGDVGDYVKHLLLPGVTSAEELSGTLSMFGVADE